MSTVIRVQWRHHALATVLVMMTIGSPAFAQRTRVVLLGTGTPNADPDRSGPAVAIIVDSTVYVVDAGPGVVRRAAAAGRDTTVAALTMERLRTAFLTQLHSDHTLGLSDFIFSTWVLVRTVALTVYGQSGN